jgi:hypothetical protein
LSLSRQEADEGAAALAAAIEATQAAVTAAAAPQQAGS